LLWILQFDGSYSSTLLLSDLLQRARCECAERLIQVLGAKGDHTISYRLHARLHGDQADPGVRQVDDEAEVFRQAMRNNNVVWQQFW
jgi:hypothetical protein